MNCIIDSADTLEVSDQELSDLLCRVYVDGGFSTAEEAASLFKPSAVRSRGKLICARDMQEKKLAGMVILVPPGSPSRRFANSNESEMHLLGVMPEFRGGGLGRKLVTAAVNTAIQDGYTKMLLATQSTMNVAHRLYQLSGFVRAFEHDFSRAGRKFLVYEKLLRE